jgi:hypothetical protein
MASTTTTLAAFVLGAAAGTGGTIAAQTYAADAATEVICEYDAAADAIICKAASAAAPNAAPAPVNQ